MGMVAWLIAGAGIGWLLANRSRSRDGSVTVIGIAGGVIGAIVGGLITELVREGQVDLEWELSGVVGAAIGATVSVLWLRSVVR